MSIFPFFSVIVNVKVRLRVLHSLIYDLLQTPGTEQTPGKEPGSHGDRPRGCSRVYRDRKRYTRHSHHGGSWEGSRQEAKVSMRWSEEASFRRWKLTDIWRLRGASHGQRWGGRSWLVRLHAQRAGGRRSLDVCVVSLSPMGHTWWAGAGGWLKRRMDLCPYKITNYSKGAEAPPKSYFIRKIHPHSPSPRRGGPIGGMLLLMAHLAQLLLCPTFPLHPPCCCPGSLGPCRVQPAFPSITTPPPGDGEAEAWDAAVTGPLEWSMEDRNLGQLDLSSGPGVGGNSKNSQKPTEANPRGILHWHLALTLTPPTSVLVQAPPDCTVTTYQKPCSRRLPTSRRPRGRPLRALTVAEGLMPHPHPTV